MPVSTKHPDYELYRPVWDKTRDAVRGSVQIKDKKHVYLPVPDPETLDERLGENTLRYRQYIRRAVFANYTGRTKNALVGAAFRKAPTFELPEGIEYLINDATGDGLGIEQLAKDELSNLLETGRTLLLVDFPQAAAGMSAEDIQRLAIRASIIPYACEQVVNWRTDTVGGRKLVTMIVLAENYKTSEDEFGHDSEVQYRVLRLREDGYTQQLYRE